ncbi:MAG: DUF2087 domain-containing protein [Clostridiales bacterium]|nr:DUF2087 domain-containing protein [Clostridiales bacterium]
MNTEKQLSNFLDANGRLYAFPARRKMKICSLMFFSESFETGRIYSEPEVNDIINSHSTFNDPATVRRELCAYGFLERTTDCKIYRKPETCPTFNTTEEEH